MTTLSTILVSACFLMIWRKRLCKIGVTASVIFWERERPDGRQFSVFVEVCCVNDLERKPSAAVRQTINGATLLPIASQSAPSLPSLCMIIKNHTLVRVNFWGDLLLAGGSVCYSGSFLLPFCSFLLCFPAFSALFLPGQQ